MVFERVLGVDRPDTVAAYVSGTAGRIIIVLIQFKSPHIQLS